MTDRYEVRGTTDEDGEDMHVVHDTVTGEGVAWEWTIAEAHDECERRNREWRQAQGGLNAKQ